MAKTVMSSPLRRGGMLGNVLWNSTAHDGRCPMLCLSTLNELVDVPKAELYWIEASTQPQVGSMAVYVRFKRYGAPHWSRRKGERTEPLYNTRELVRALHQLGVGEKPKRIYFRIWYQ